MGGAPLSVWPREDPPEWSDERFCKLFTRDTGDWLDLTIEEQWVYTAVLRKADPRGVIVLRRGLDTLRELLRRSVDEWRARILPALKTLADRGYVELGEQRLVLPHYVEAHESPKSAKLRKQDERARKAADQAERQLELLPDPPDSVTIRDTDPVTNRDREAGDGSRSVTVTRSRQTDRQTHEIDQKRSSAASAPDAPAAPPRGTDEHDPETLRELWNELCAPAGCPGWDAMNDPRRRQAKARLKERPLAAWREVYQRIAKSSFLTGRGERPFRASPDWVLRPSSIIKVLEGNYDDAPPRSSPGRAALRSGGEATVHRGQAAPPASRSAYGQGGRTPV